MKPQPRLTRAEVERMIHFLYRMPMYIGRISQEGILAFMHGADFGKRHEPYWTKLLNEYINDQCKIYGGAVGWPAQVEKFSKKHEIDWTEAFKLLMLSMLRNSAQIPFTKKHEALCQQFEERDRERK